MTKTWVACASVFWTLGCATLPPPGAGRALHTDLDQIVDSRERTEWVVDRVEIAEVEADLMYSACSTPKAERRALKRFLDTRLQLAGGSPEAAWEKAGRDLDAAREALHVQRMGLLLDHAEAHVAECPFWLQGEADFAGIHADAGRLVVVAETMGAFQIVLADGNDASIGGAGLGRLLFGWGIDHHLTVLLGYEMGLASELTRGEGREVVVTPGFALGFPAVLRVHRGSLRWDTGVSLTGRSADPDFSDPRFGVRWDQSIGVATLRIAGVQPHVMIWAGHEWLPEDGDRPSTHSIRMGSRVGVNWDP